MNVFIFTETKKVIGERICKKCGVLKNGNEFYGHGGFTCKECANKRSNELYWLKHEEKLVKGKEYREKNKEVIKKRAAQQRIKYNHSEYSNKKRHEYRNNLTDSYIRERLKESGFSSEKITDAIMQKKRAEVMAERIKKQLEKLGVKVCSHCNKQKDISEFVHRKFIWKGVQKISIMNICKKCDNKRSYEYRKKSKYKN